MKKIIKRMHLVFSLRLWWTVADPWMKEPPEPRREAGASGASIGVGVGLVWTEKQDKIEGYSIWVMYFKSKGHKNKWQLPKGVRLVVRAPEYTQQA
jgi:hypothetical protein